jgi:uncharacterized protein YoxC
MGIKDVSNEEITPTVLRYMIKDLDEKVTSNHSDVLERIGRMESKIDLIINQYNNIKVENAEIKKDVNSNKEKIDSMFKWLGAMSIAIVAGIINFLLAFIKK